MSDICQHFLFGYCRYNEKCFKKHVEKVCDDNKCEIEMCELRHPKKCLYFEQFGYCKYGDFFCTNM